MPTAAQLQIAYDLEAAGLLPPGVERQEYHDGPIWWYANEKRWEPWRDIGAVWHLVLRFGLSIHPPDGDIPHWYVVDTVKAFSAMEMADAQGKNIPTAIIRLALKMVGADKEEQ